MGRRLGLVVGVNNYQDTIFQPLQFAENDARAFAQWLVNDKGGKWEPANVQYVYGANATRDLVESLTLQLCLSVAQADDLVLIYIASHAFVDVNSGNGCLALADTKYSDPRTGLNLLALAQQVITRSSAAQIVFILDSFQTEQAWNARRTAPFDVLPLLGPTLLTGLQQQRNRIFMCSCRGNEFGAETGERGLGQLMLRMIVGLSGAATDTTGNSTLQSLYTYLMSVLGEQQRPQVFGQAPDPIVLVGDIPDNQQRLQTFPPTNAPSATPYETHSSSQAAQAQQSFHKATATAQMSPSPPQQNLQQSSLLLEQAMRLFQMQNMEEALRLTNQALQFTPDSSSGLTLKSQILGMMGRFPEALTTADQLRQKEPSNALAWSMGAVLLSNMGRNQEALTAIEHSLELDASNPESYAIKTNIMSSIAVAQNSGKSPPKNGLIASEKRRGWPMSFFVGAIVQLVGLMLGIAGGLLPVARPTLPIALSFLLESGGLAILCVNAARSSYLYGFLRVFVTLIFSLLAAAILGISIGYRPVYRQIIVELQAHTRLLQPLIFLGGWLIVAAVLPLLLAIIGFISGVIVGVRRRK